jgi:hypothetical protein
VQASIPAYIEVNGAFVATTRAVLSDWISASKSERGGRKRLAQQLVKIATTGEDATVDPGEPLLPQLLA